MLGDNDIIASIDGRKNKATFDGDIKNMKGKYERGNEMKRIIKINENEYISKEVEHTTSLTGTIIELIIYLSLLAALTKFVNNWL